MECVLRWTQSLHRHQQNRGSINCDGAAVSSFTQRHPIQCDTHSAATRVWDGSALHTNLHGLVTGQTLLSPPAPAWRNTDTATQTSHHTTRTELSGQFTHWCKDDSSLGLSIFPPWTHPTSLCRLWQVLPDSLWRMVLNREGEIQQPADLSEV